MFFLVYSVILKGNPSLQVLINQKSPMTWTTSPCHVQRKLLIKSDHLRLIIVSGITFIS